MKALSLRQPYADLVATGRKTIELRTWKTKHRGEFYIHASKYSPPAKELESFNLKHDDLDYGAIIGVAEITGTKNYNDYPKSEWSNDVPYHLAGSDYITSLNGFILENARKFTEAIPYKGYLNFFNVDDIAVVLRCNSTPTITFPTVPSSSANKKDRMIESE